MDTPTAVPAKAHWPGPGVIISQAWEGFKSNLKPAAVYGVVAGAAVILDMIVFPADSGRTGFEMASSGGSLFTFIATIIFLVGLPLLGLAMADKKELPVAKLFTFDMRTLYMIGMYILVGLGVALGLLLLIIPGIILALMWSFTIYEVAEKRAGPIQSMKESARITKGYRLSIFVLALITLLMAIPMVILVFVPFVGMILFSALTTFFYGIYAVACRYLQGEKASSSAPAGPAAPVAV